MEAYARGHKLIVTGVDMNFPDDETKHRFKELSKFHELVYDARKLLIEKYICDFKMDARKYFDRYNELPLPPMVFWPGEIGPDGMTAVAPEDMFPRINSECYVIRGGPSVNGPVVVAGIVPFHLVRKAFVDFAVVEELMIANYLFRSLFTAGTAEVYSPVIDGVYEDTFYKLFEFSIRPRIETAEWKPRVPD